MASIAQRSAIAALEPIRKPEILKGDRYKDERDDKIDGADAPLR
jgi:hypothetical protein